MLASSKACSETTECRIFRKAGFSVKESGVGGMTEVVPMARDGLLSWRGGASGRRDRACWFNDLGSGCMYYVYVNGGFWGSLLDRQEVSRTIWGFPSRVAMLLKFCSVVRVRGIGLMRARKNMAEKDGPIAGGSDRYILHRWKCSSLDPNLPPPEVNHYFRRKDVINLILKDIS